MKAEEKARELYPVKNQHVPTIGGRTAYVDVNEKARNAFLEGYEYANQQPEVEEFCNCDDSYKWSVDPAFCGNCSLLLNPEQGEVETPKQIIDRMSDEMPFRLSESVKPYIYEAMRIYKNKSTLTQDKVREAAIWDEVWETWCNKKIQSFDEWLHDKLMNSKKH